MSTRREEDLGLVLTSSHVGSCSCLLLLLALLLFHLFLLLLVLHILVVLLLNLRETNYSFKGVTDVIFATFLASWRDSLIRYVKLAKTKVPSKIF